MKKVTLIVKNNDDLINYLVNNTDYSKNKIKSFFKYKKIVINDKIVQKLPMKVTIDDVINIYLDHKENIPFDIVYEDDEILVVNKEAGILTVASLNDHTNTLYRMVREYAKKHHFLVFIVNRLDKETSGIVMFAKSERMKRLYQDNWNELVTKRKYLAVVEGKIEQDGRIENLLYEEKNTFVHSSKLGKKAITNYHVLKSNDKYTLLDINIETGRKNQIRVHMSEMGHPIVGDIKYGSMDNSFKRMALHAYELEIKHPITNKMQKFSLLNTNLFDKFLL